MEIAQINFSLQGESVKGTNLTLFVLLAAEGLSCLLKSRNQSSNLSGIKVVASAPMVSHLLFAYDNLLFFKVNRESADVVKDVKHLLPGLRSED
jgi:hypothetical protein